MRRRGRGQWGDSSPAATAAFGILGDQGDGGTPVRGGALSSALYTPVASLDPTVTQAAGATGGTEMAAVYDVLMRYDSRSQTFEPQLAKSIEERSDHRTWTLKLRDGVTFSDGTPLAADAVVVASINRYNQRRGANSQLYTQMVESTVVQDRPCPWRRARMPMLRRVWIEFDPDPGSVLWWISPYAGVTGFDERDCLAMVAELLPGGAELPLPRNITVDISLADGPSVNPLALGVPVWRGVWYPAVNLETGPNTSRRGRAA